MKLIGVDIGKEGDPSAFSTIDVKVQDKETAADLRTRGWGVVEERGETIYTMIHIENLPIKMNYPAVVAKIKRHMLIPAIANEESYLVIEINGPGGPIIDYCLYEGLAPIGIYVTNGYSFTEREDNGYNVGKQLIVTNFQTLFQTRRFQYSSEIPEEDKALFKYQLQHFVRKKNPRTGYEAYENERPEDHDDMVMCTATPLWYAERILMAGYLRRSTRGDRVSRPYNPLMRRKG